MPGGGDEHFSALLVTLDPGGRSGAVTFREGTRALAYCARGKVRVTLGGELHVLSCGDAVLVEETEVACENHGRARAEIIVFSARVR